MEISERLRYSITHLGKVILSPTAGLSRYFHFVILGFRHMVTPPLSFILVLRQFEFVGNRSFVIVIMAGAMVGAVFGFQLGDILRIFGAESMIGAAAGFALTKELAPVIGSFLVTGRAGSSMAAEIATMRVNEQIDAMRVMAVNPYAYLVSPRIFASMLMMPLLTGLFILSGCVMAYVVAVLQFDVDVAIFIEKMQWIVRPKHVFQGLEKAVVFGFIMSSIGCFQGFHAAGGAKGVGKATTKAVVISLVTILITDFFLSYFQFDQK